MSATLPPVTLPTTAPAATALSTEEKYARYVNTSFLKRLQPVVVERALGARIEGTDGVSYIDCYAGIAVVNTGHCNPAVAEAAKAQIDKSIHMCSYVYYNQPMGDLAEKVAEITPGRLRKSFFGNSGAEAVEGALRLARRATGRHEFVALETSFHGRTHGALSVTGNSGRKKGAGPLMSGVHFMPAPYCYRCPFNTTPDKCQRECAGASLERLLMFQTQGDVAGYLAEPVLGEGGIVVPPADYFHIIKQVLDKHGILFLCDEVQTGFARTGKMFAIEHFGVEPDIMTMAKGIADGFPLGCFIARPEVADTFQPGDHLSTFGGNPVSCAAAVANIDYIEGHDLCAESARKGDHALGRLRAMAASHPMIGDVRGLGLMIGIELVKDRTTKEPAGAEAGRIQDIMREHGVLIGVGGVFGNVVRFQPPLVITDADLDQAIDIFERALTAVA